MLVEGGLPHDRLAEDEMDVRLPPTQLLQVRCSMDGHLFVSGACTPLNSFKEGERPGVCLLARSSRWRRRVSAVGCWSRSWSWSWSWSWSRIGARALGRIGTR